MASEAAVLRLVYGWTVERGKPPRADEVAAEMGTSREEVLEQFARLRQRRLLLLAPVSGEIVMAPPFAAAPTPFQVHAGGRSYFANCVWDSLGVAAALGEDARVEASCACCGEPMTLRVGGGAPPADSAVAHFAVPAANWWDDLVFT